MNVKVYQLLGYGGLCPFIIFLCLQQYSLSYLSIDPIQAFIFYSVTIFSFIAGTLWRKDNAVTNKKTQCMSNVFCLYAFVCLFLPVIIALGFLLMGYLLLFITERSLTKNKTDSEVESYLKMRLILTMSVSCFHAIAIMLLY